MDIEFRESTVNDLKRIVELAENWENEEITYGYIAGN